MFKKFIRKLLSHRLLPVGIVILAAFITSPSIHLGLQIDDYWHFLYTASSSEGMTIRERMGMKGYLENVPLNLFRFFDAFPGQNDSMIHNGYMPWWAARDMSLNFLRPLSAMTHWMEYRLLRNQFVWMHIHNILWYAALAGVVTFFYRRMMQGAWVSGWAALIFVLHDRHAAHLISISQRNALMSAFSGVLTILFHIRWRESDRSGLRYAALSFFILSLTSADAGIITLAFLLSYAITLESASWRSRIFTLIPYIIFALIWRGINYYMDYGAYHNLMYVDPGREPLRFLSAVIERVPLVLHSLISFPPAEVYWLLSDQANLIFSMVSTLILVLFGYLILPLLRQSAVARFWALSMLLAVIPACAITPDGRNLLLAGIAGIGLMIQFITAWNEAHTPWRRSGYWRVPAWVFTGIFVLYHMILSPVIHIGRYLSQDTESEGIFSRTCNFDIPASIADRASLIIVNPITQIYSYYPAVCYVHDFPLARYVRTLGDGTTPVEIHRLDRRTISVKLTDGFYPAPGEYQDRSSIGFIHAHPYNAMRRVNRYYRMNAPPMQVGEILPFPDVSVEIREITDDGRPLVVEYRFPEALESRRYFWYQWSWKEMNHIRFEVPDVGERVMVVPEL
ncbi:MAG: hypothetical protein ACOX5R_13655 [bacterium]|jgi:hypothetical protein